MMLPRNSVAVEVGVFKGEFTEHILQIVHPSHLHLIDPWWKKFGTYFPDWGSYTDFGRLKTKDAYAQLLRIIKDFDNHHVSKIHVGRSSVVLPQFPDRYFDWAYLDSTHSYEDTKEELSLLRYKVKTEGLITGHDWQEDLTNIHHGVYKAVNEFIHTYDYRITYLDNYLQWALRKK